MQLSSLLGLLLATPSLASIDPEFNPDQQIVISSPFAQNCSISSPSSTEVATGDVSIRNDPLLNPIFHRFDKLNSSTWDYWLFIGLAEDGKTGFGMSLFQDGSGSIRGKPNFRSWIGIMLPDGSHFDAHDFHTSAVMEECADGPVKGVWSNADSVENEEDVASITFSFDPTFEDATVILDMPKVKGTLVFHSTSSAPRWANGESFPSESGDGLLAPGMWWTEPMSGAKVSADLTVQGKEVVFKGAGGHDRIWSSLSWPQLAQSWLFIRAFAGPYTLSFCGIVSASEPGAKFRSVWLEKDGEKVFGTQSDSVSLLEDYVVLNPLYSGDVKGDWQELSTGYLVDLVSPATGKHWHFEIDHNKLWWTAPTGPRGTGNSGFMAKFSGGEVDGEQFEAWGLSSRIQFDQDPRGKYQASLSGEVL